MSNIDNISMTSEGIPAQVMCTSGVATPGSTRAQTLVKFVCALVKLLNNRGRHECDLATHNTTKVAHSESTGYIAIY